MAKEKNSVGAPSKFTNEKAKQICEATATSNKSLKTICAELDLKVRTVLDWLAENKEFSQMYAQSKEEQADLLAEEIIEIADDSTRDTQYIYKDGKKIAIEDKEWTNRSRLRVDARKWVAAKLKPRKYGDRIDHNIEGEQTIIVKFEE